MNTLNRVTILTSLFVIASCGGGGGGGGSDSNSGGGYGGGGSTPTNYAPVISNTVTDFVTVGNDANVFAVTASDQNTDDTLTFTLSGNDASNFSVDTTGQVSFSPIPDYAAYTDSDSNNIYEVTVTVSDGTLSDQEAFTVNLVSPSLSISLGNNNTSSITLVENTTSIAQISVLDVMSAAIAIPAIGNISFTISGDDASAVSISNSGQLTFVSSPDFEVPNDTDANNIYNFTLSATNSIATSDRSITVIVTNDTSDDAVTSYDGVVVGASPIQSATVCVTENAFSCAGATFSTTTAQDGSFSLTVDSGTTGVLRSEGGFDPVTTLPLGTNYGFVLSQPVTDADIVISPLSNLFTSNPDYTTIKNNLGIASDFMIRFDNPNSTPRTGTKLTVMKINTQLAILDLVLNQVTTPQLASAWVYDAVLNRRNDLTGSETSLGDTEFIKYALSLAVNYGAEDLTLDSNKVIAVSAVVSSYLQKVFASADDSQSYWLENADSYLVPLVANIVSGSVSHDSTDVDNAVFDTVNASGANIEGNFDIESSIKETTYMLTNSGSSYYMIDDVNQKTTNMDIYVKEGDVIKFSPSSSVTSAHPFKLSTSIDDMNGANDIGATEGWDQSTLTLTVNANTPSIIYPHCQFHSGMYSSGKIVKVSSYDMANIDTTNATSALKVKGTVKTGPFKGASGFTYNVYLTSQGGSEHTHTFYEYPGLTFYMPAGQGYHGSSNANVPIFKPKSHYASTNDGVGEGSEGGEGEGSEGGGGYDY